MSFEFTSTAVSVARQHQLWGLLIGAAGLGVAAFVVARGKPAAFNLVALALIAAGGWYLFQSWQLGRTDGEWVISVNGQQLSWQSPNETLDPSFVVSLAEIDYLDLSAMAARGDERPLYHLILNDGNAIHLNPISGIDFPALSQHLSTLGIETRETGRFHLPLELRNR